MYYNLSSSFWEPLIEHTKFVIDLDDFSIKVRCKSGIDINISDDFINVLSLTWKSWNEKDEKPKNYVNDDKGVCPYSVMNKKIGRAHV